MLKRNKTRGYFSHTVEPRLPAVTIRNDVMQLQDARGYCCDYFSDDDVAVGDVDLPAVQKAA